MSNGVAMWNELQKWYQLNRDHLKIFLITSLVTGGLIASLGLIFPSVMSFYASLSLIGASLSFLTVWPLPLSVLALGTIASGIIFTALCLGAVVLKQLVTIGEQTLSSLSHAEKEQLSGLPTEEHSYHYLMNHLRPEPAPRTYQSTDEEAYEMIPSDEIHLTPDAPIQPSDTIFVICP